jgi:hypothetical protein
MAARHVVEEHLADASVAVSMKTLFSEFKDEGEVVASWREARLIKYLGGKTELRGGSGRDAPNT